jgi:hypothetical protein
MKNSKIALIRKEIEIFKTMDLFENSYAGISFEEYNKLKKEHILIHKELNDMNADVSNRHYSYDFDNYSVNQILSFYKIK